MENKPFFFFMAARLNLTTKEGVAEGGGNEFMAIENIPCFPQAMKYTGAMDDYTSQDFLLQYPSVWKQP